MHPWLIDGRRVANGYWDSKSNRIQYLRWLESQLNYSKPEDWYKISLSDFVNYKGDSIYRHVYNQDRMRIVNEIYPEVDWKPWLFKRMPINTWSDPLVVREYLDWIFEQEGFSDYTDWYSIKRKDLNKYPGSTIFNNKFGGSHRVAIKEYYPEYDWKDWLFFHSPPGYWIDDDNCRKYLEWLANELNFSELDDWYTLDQNRLNANYGHGMYRRFSGSPEKMIRYFFPHHEWDDSKFNNKHKNELLVLKYCRDIFPTEEIFSQFKHHKIRSSTSNRPLELDIWIPSLNLAIEYQGEQHYQKGWSFLSQNEFDKISQRDQDKKQGCYEIGIKLIEIPYTWDQTKNYVIKLLSDFMDV
jgi:hypothetical protein